MAQQVKDPVLSLKWLGSLIGSLAQELSYAGRGQKKKNVSIRMSIFTFIHPVIVYSY